MNQITASVSELSSVDGITIVSFETAGGTCLKMMALALDTRVQVGSVVVVAAKATNIALSKTKLEGVSISNQIEATITSLEMGSLLCRVIFTFGDVSWESVITKDSALRMRLKEGESVVALVKSSDLSLVEVTL